MYLFRTATTANLSYSFSTSESESYENHSTFQQDEASSENVELEQHADKEQDQITYAVVLFILRTMEVHKTSQVVNRYHQCSLYCMNYALCMIHLYVYGTFSEIAYAISL